MSQEDRFVEDGRRIQSHTAGLYDRAEIEQFVCPENNKGPLGIEKEAEHKGNDRTYHEFHRGKYMLPNDEEEQDRLDFLHHALLQVTGRLTHVPHPTDARVLDLGCGTGIWAIDFAEAFPDSFVVGVDLSSIQPSGHPPNCHFYAPFDFEFPWAKLGEESWDVIRLQMCGGSVVNWPSLYRRVSAHLRPDAWFEQVDIDFQPRCEGRALDGSALYNWYHNLRQATRDAARPISHQFQAIIDHLQNAGFTDIKHKQFVLPLNRWHSDLWMQHIGGWYGRAFFDSIEPLSLAPFRRILNWTPDEIQHLVTDAKSELLDPAAHTFHVLHIYIARKPTPTSMCASVESDR
ncbi:hypothetical protein KXV55_005769 [Aspergillus fumigatus]|nr:hypothetical protein KXW37_006428 [Aspergillus fumigatus]KAH3502617.1 hypothetical protein KXV55_005769 [Aspergillus fumigatus]KAH3604278.1 hypothetical protein KXV56_005330 [Aspergillus fumigatus]RHZ66649.1 hypothetical protein CDV55_101640 [Aspergillus turcosus]